jgi:DNA-binding Lrp family transcriptional regulator
MAEQRSLDAVDRAIVNRLQRGFPVCERPYRETARELGISESELIERLRGLLGDGVLSRFGPLYHIERAGGAMVLGAMQVPPHELERVIDAVNTLPEVAHNYLREHRFNLWFVLAAPSPAQIDDASARIEAQTGHPVWLMPKLREYFLDLHLPV